MKAYIYLSVGVMLLTLATSCEKMGRSEYNSENSPPSIVVLEKNIPGDASLTAELTFRIEHGTPPFFIYPTDSKVELVDEKQWIFRITDIHPRLRPQIITVMDSDFKSDTTSLFFPVPEIKAEGLYKHPDGTLEVVNYKFKNFGTENDPNYMLIENVYSNVYSYGGNNKDVAGNIAISGGYDGQRSYSRYTFPQAFGLTSEKYDDPSDTIYNPLSGNVYNQVFQGICPKYWHIPNNDEWLRTLSDIGINLSSSPNASLAGDVFNFRYMHSDAEKALFETKFETGYSYADGTYPTDGSPGVGYWSSSMTKDKGQYVLYLRFTEGNMSLEQWGGLGTGGGRGWYFEHVRCRFDF